MNALSPASRSQSAVPGAERRRLRTIGVMRLVEGVLLAGVALMGMVFLLRAGGSGIFDAIATTEEALWRRVIAGRLPPFGIAAAGIGLVGVALVVLDAALALGGRGRPGPALQASIGALVIAGLLLTVVTETRYQAELKPWPALTRQVEAFRPPAGARLVQTRNEGPETGASLPAVIRVWVVRSTVDRICENAFRSFGTWAGSDVRLREVRATGLFCAADARRDDHGAILRVGPTLNAVLGRAIGPPIEVDGEAQEVDVYFSVRIRVSVEER